MNPPISESNPELLVEWDYQKNRIDPSKVTSGSDKMAWWICPNGHSYQAAIHSRSSGTGCPYCVNRRAHFGYNSALDTNPELLDGFDFEKNDTTLGDVTASSHKKFWWRCELGHSYQQALYSKLKGTKCPYCTNRRVLIGFNDLATSNPELVDQWYSPLNNPVTPNDVTSGSNKKFWWICSEGHVWQTTVFCRTKKKPTGCPVCAGQVKISKYKYPMLV